MRDMTATLPEHKAARAKFDENEHPRDRKGRFIEKGATVSVWGAGGTTGTVVRNLGGGRILIKRTSDGREVSVHRNYLTVQARPDGADPTDKPEDTPEALPEEPDAPAVTPPAEAPDQGDTTGPAPLDDLVFPKPDSMPDAVDADDPGGAARAAVNGAAAASARAEETGEADDHKAAMVAHRRAGSYPGVEDTAGHYAWQMYHSEQWRIASRTPAKQRAYDRAAAEAERLTAAVDPSDSGSVRAAARGGG
jgi:hypothetical protein